MKQFILAFVLTIFVFGCVKRVDPDVVAAEGTTAAEEDTAPTIPIKSRPTWETRSFKNWRQPDCQAEAENCKSMGRATVLVEFVHNGCRTYRQRIEDQALLMKGYMPDHLFLLIVVASDALTKAVYDKEPTKDPPCRVFFYDDTLKPDKKMPNEEQWFVELCKDTTNITDGECGSQLAETRLYSP